MGYSQGSTSPIISEQELLALLESTLTSMQDTKMGLENWHALLQANVNNSCWMDLCFSPLLLFKVSTYLSHCDNIWYQETVS